MHSKNVVIREMLARRRINEVVNEMTADLGYTRAEAWERIADELLYLLETHALDAPSVDETVELASMMVSIEIVDLTRLLPGKGQDEYNHQAKD